MLHYYVIPALYRYGARVKANRTEIVCENDDQNSKTRYETDRIRIALGTNIRLRIDRISNA